VIMVVFVGLLALKFRGSMTVDPRVREQLATIDPASDIHDRPLMIRALIVLAATIVGFLLHAAIGVEAATIALLGATVLMIIGPLDPHDALRDIEWSTLFFFVGLFMLIEAVVHVGIVGTVADTLAQIAGGNQALATIGILWISALGSAVVDNIPYTATAIPIVERMAEGGLEADPLWWALALGACLGGNLTIIGASANIVVANLAERDGHPIGFMRFVRYGSVVVLMSLAISTAYLWARYLT
jgi:Na+/H+ antiporter NhaD/arsenite permease-like protein